MLEMLEWMATAEKRLQYLVAVSGGADSVALLRLMVSHQFEDLVLCHMNHGLRGSESDADAQFVLDLGKELRVPVELEVCDVSSLAAGSSIEAAARSARHHFFAECARRWSCPRILLAHHADDQAETALWNLARGSRGLSGMRQRQTLEIAGQKLELIRPLLGTRRSELRRWLLEQGFAWREDLSNSEPIAVRNRLRHEVLPLLSEVTGRDVIGSLAKACESDRELRELEAWAVTQAGAVDPQGRLHVGRLRELPEAVRRACLYDFLLKQGAVDLSRQDIDRVASLLDPNGAARIMLSRGLSVRRKEGRIWVG